MSSDEYMDAAPQGAADGPLLIPWARVSEWLTQEDPTEYEVCTYILLSFRRSCVTLCLTRNIDRDPNVIDHS